jgi:hypothetical protein
MLIIINDSPKIFSKKVRAIIGRYAWRVSRDVWIWPKISIRLNVIDELEQHKEKISIIFLWPDKNTEFGFSHYVHGNFANCHTEHGFFNHKGYLDDN